MPMPGIAVPCLMGAQSGADVAFLAGDTNNSGSFSGVNFGPASADRYLLLMGQASVTIGTRNMTAASIGGVAATPLAGEVNRRGFIAHVPAGASGNIDITHSGGTGTGTVIFNLFALTGLKNGGVPTDILGVVASGSLDVLAGGVILGVGSNSAAWTGLERIGSSNHATRKFKSAVSGHSIAGPIIGAFSFR